MKVFKLNDCDWYMAETLEEAIEIAMKDCGSANMPSGDDGIEGRRQFRADAQAFLARIGSAQSARSGKEGEGR